MRPLDDHLEVAIGKADVDDNWQVKDLEAIIRPYLGQTRTVGAQMLAALKDAEGGTRGKTVAAGRERMAAREGRHPVAGSIRGLRGGPSRYAAAAVMLSLSYED